MESMETVEKQIPLIANILRFFYLIAGISLVALFILIFGDVFGRIFGYPIKGSYELSEFLMVAIGFLPLAYGQLKGMHVRVTFVTERLPSKLQAHLDFWGTLLVALFFSVMTWQIAVRCYTTWTRNILLGQTQVALPVWIPYFIAGLGTFFMVVILVIELKESFRNVFKR